MIWLTTNLAVKIFPSQGFPGSVTPDYVPFQVWDSLQVKHWFGFLHHVILYFYFYLFKLILEYLKGLSTYIRAMLSTQVSLCSTFSFFTCKIKWVKFFMHILMFSNYVVYSTALGPIKCYWCWRTICHSNWCYFSGTFFSLSLALLVILLIK